MNAYGGVEVELHAFWTSVIYWSKVTSSSTSGFTPMEKAPGFHSNCGPHIQSGPCEEVKNVLLSNPDSLTVKPLTPSYTDWAESLYLFIYL
jgi:hypothetical protein